MNGPLVIAHRGASGYRPEHTAAAYRLGYRQGADSVEPDLVLTRDGVPVCRHDLDLARTTDIASRPEFADRARPVRRKGGRTLAWWVHDLDLEELRTLRARERWPSKRAESASYDGELPVLTFEELLDLRDDEEGLRGRPLGVHAELKHGDTFHALGLSLDDAVADVLDRRGLNHPGSGVTLMGFEKKVMRRLARRTSVPRVLLVHTQPSQRRLDRLPEYVDAIGARKDLVVPRLRLDTAGQPTRLVARAHERGLGVLVWTLRNENQYLPAHLRRGVRPRRHGDARAEVRMFLDAGVDGVLTDFPDVAHDVRLGHAHALPLGG